MASERILRVVGRFPFQLVDWRRLAERGPPFTSSYAYYSKFQYLNENIVNDSLLFSSPKI